MNDFPNDHDQEKWREEFEHELMEHLDALYRAALRLTDDVRDAEDLVQDSCLKAFRFLHRFRQGTNFKAWIFKILNNLWINRFQRSIREPSLVNLAQAAELRASDGPSLADPERDLFDKFMDDEVKAALDKLPPQFRAVVLLRDVEGFTYQEIADIVGCPLNTVRSRLSRGRRALRPKLLEYARRRGYMGYGDARRLVRDRVAPASAPARLKEGVRRKLAKLQNET